MRLNTFAALVAFAVTASQAQPPRPTGIDAEAFGSCVYDPSTTQPLQIDLGYSIYKGRLDAVRNHSIFQGIRFAQAPVGKLRWQAPQPPLVNRTTVLDASFYQKQCPQSSGSTLDLQVDSNIDSSEDCLFLNVWSPSNATRPLPVLVWVHGGGYGLGNGQTDPGPLISVNGNRFVAVTIQYRLGAFGFLASDELHRRGVVNAGLLDQEAALRWVQKYIHFFNGDPDQVTVYGESAGAGGVMLLDVAYGGTLGTSLFRNSIAASPYLPMQYGYKDWIPSQTYYAFASAAGCYDNQAYGNKRTTTIFNCLIEANTSTLMNASSHISQSGLFGTWAFLPTTDGTFIQDIPSRLLLAGKVNGLSALVGNNANEGWAFTPPIIFNNSDLVSWLHRTFPLFSPNDIGRVLALYQPEDPSTQYDTPPYATPHDRASLIYGEATFVCPSYWLAEAYSNRADTRSFKYQYSPAPALHGTDVRTVFSAPGESDDSLAFQTAFQRLIGNFVIYSDPSLSNSVANGGSPSNGSANPASTWPPFFSFAPFQIDLNFTCDARAGATRVPVGYGSPYYYCDAPAGAANNITLTNAYTMLGGRGARCEFWRAMGSKVPG